MESRLMNMKYQQAILLLVTLALYAFYFQFNETVDLETCRLCDAKEYNKVYSFFKTGVESQIPFPFYSRPLIPFLASLIPVGNVSTAFHIINLIFILLSVLTIHSLWNILSIKPWLKWIGFIWLLTHWSGLIRYNLFDHLTVDTPLYFVQPLSLILFFKRKYKWFYLLTPLAILQKESFLAITIVLLCLHIWMERKDWFQLGKHLLFSLMLGVFIQKAALFLLPEQLDQRSSFLAILYHGKLALDEPSRFIRWFSAFGSAFGVLPFLILFNIKSFKLQNQKELTLLILSIMYGLFGLLAGEDMTRILFLGFPFIMTLSLLLFQNESKWLMAIGLSLSAISLHLYPFPVDNKWGVDYAALGFVYQWALYFFMAVILFFGSFMFFRNRTEIL